MVTVTAVAPGSPAERHGILPGDILVTLNGHTVRDILDYRFYLTEKTVRLVCVRAGVKRETLIRKGTYDDIGLDFETYLMDRKKTCRNRCVFCFIDQNPPGMRESIYFKDDDERLSFLQGNYITLTNLTEGDIRRMIEMHLSPVNISVHTFDPALRVRMTGNPAAGDCLRWLRLLSDAGISLNLQFVLCRGINDGEVLSQSLKILEEYPSFASAAFVPAGLTGHREKLFPLDAYDASSAKDVLARIEQANAAFRARTGEGKVYAADEFYLLAQAPLPEDSYYDGYPQLENGVGMLTNLRTEFSDALDTLEPPLPGTRVTSVTGEAAYPFLRALAADFTRRFPDCVADVRCVKNKFYGGSVTVAGLLTGQDILAALQAQPPERRLLLPAAMLRSGEEIFLDDMTLPALATALGVTTRVVKNDGYDLAEAFAGR